MFSGNLVSIEKRVQVSNCGPTLKSGIYVELWYKTKNRYEWVIQVLLKNQEFIWTFGPAMGTNKLLPSQQRTGIYLEIRS